MYNDRNRQMPNGARQFPTTNRLGGDIPRLDSDQGGTRCDGSRDRAMHDQMSRERTSYDQVLRERTGNNGRSCNQVSRERTACGCMALDRSGDGKNASWGLHSHPLAMVYSPYQHFREIYTPDTALDRGTLFSELDLPFEGSNNRRNGGCAR